MKIGFLIPKFDNEKRVALLPSDIKNFNNTIAIEKGFGLNVNIKDAEYKKAGCIVLERKDIFKRCEAIFSLKLLQPSDYEFIRHGQMIIGWTHPHGSGKEFMETQAIPKELIVVDLDNITPSIFYKDMIIPIDWLKRNFVYKNSIMAGWAATYHAILSFGRIPDVNTRVAVLSSGNVAQGGFQAISKFGCDIRMFYRKTMNEFKEKLENFDIIINGIEMDDVTKHILTLDEQKRLKKNCLVIDAAADAGHAIEGSRKTTIRHPLYKKDDVYYYVVDNAPSIFYRDSSKIISKSFSKFVYCKDLQIYYDMINEYEKKAQ
ncbi:MAG: N(5)-(carboxyethyl)ornithine synthase [Bacilli bacterium]